ncbi:ribonuclease H-like domain-containing protein [Tanacetum coccineum]
MLIVRLIILFLALLVLISSSFQPYEQMMKLLSLIDRSYSNCANMSGDIPAHLANGLGCFCIVFHCGRFESCSKAILLAIVNVKIVGAENYKMWATAMKIALKWKNKMGFIDGWILGSLSQELYVGQVYSEVAFEVWTELKETYDKMDGSVVFNLMHKINNLKQEDLSVPDYYHKLNSLWREFDILTILPVYVCEGRPACTCDAKSTSTKHTQLIRLMQFLMGLNDVYQPIRSTILDKDPLPNVKDAFYVVSREESHRGLHPGSSSTNKVNQSVPGTSGSISSSFTNEQMMKLLSLINEKPTPTANMFFCAKTKTDMYHVTLGWIIDFGANQHMTDSTKDMFNVVLRLTSGVVLFDVLVVPEYSVSLLSVNKMIKDSKFFVGFDEHKCYIQDLNLGKLVGTGSESGGLYLFDLDKIGKFANCNSVFVCHVSCELWHCRLGHPADQVLSILGLRVVVRLLFYGKDLGLSHVRSFGCLCYSTILNDNDKFRVRSEKCVLFYENVFPFKMSNDISKESNKITKNVDSLSESEEHSLNFFDVQIPVSPYDEKGDTSNVDGNPMMTSDDYFTVEDEVASVPTQIEDNVTFEGNIHMNKNGEGQSNTMETSPELRRSTRQRVMPARFNDFVVNSSVRYGLEKYIEAMNLEMEALFRNNTYVLADLPPGRKAIGCKWIWKIKYKSSGEIDRYKARLVAKVLVKERNGWPLFQLDVNNAFLYGDLKVEVYMELPPGYYDKNETRVCKLVKSLYGLKQAPRQWNEKLTTALVEHGFVQSKNDYPLYVKSKNDIFIAILVYVDDIVVTGIEVLENENEMCLYQRKYCLELLSEYGLLACKPAATPLQQNAVLGYEESQSDKFLSNMSEYQKIVGKLIYLSITRLDISYAVHCLGVLVETAGSGATTSSIGAMTSGAGKSTLGEGLNNSSNNG